MKPPEIKVNDGLPLTAEELADIARRKENFVFLLERMHAWMNIIDTAVKYEAWGIAKVTLDTWCEMYAKRKGALLIGAQTKLEQQQRAEFVDLNRRYRAAVYLVRENYLFEED